MLPFPTRMIPVTTTSLHIPDRAQFRPAFIAHPDLAILEMREPSVAYYRFLYDAVGRDYVWIDRFFWTDAQYQEYLSRPTTTVVVLYFRGTPVGYIDLDASAEESETEIVYFGLIRAVHGRGFGKHLLSVGVRRGSGCIPARSTAHMRSRITWRAASSPTRRRRRMNRCLRTGSRPYPCHEKTAVELCCYDRGNG